MEVIGYCRVSSREQFVNSEALTQQKVRVRPHCDRLIVDVESGSSRRRPGFTEIEKLIAQGLVRKVVCTRLDRLTRSLAHLQRFLELVAANNVEVVCLDDNFDLTTATGRFHANIIGSVAEMEAAMLSERVKHGWAYFRQQKKIHSPPFGYRINGQNYLELDHEPFVCLIESRECFSRYQVARMLIDWYIDPPLDSNGRKRRSLRRVIELLNKTFGIQVLTTYKGRASYGALRFSASGLRDWLDNPVLRGHTAYLKKSNKNSQRKQKEEWLVERGTHEALITEDESRMIENFSRSNTFQNAKGQNKRKLPASGLIRCARCRGVCYSQSGSRGKQPGKNYYYQCHRWSSKACDQKTMIRVEKAEAAIVDALLKEAEELKQSYAIPEEGNVIPPKVLELQASLEALERLPYNPALEESKAALQRQIQETYAQLQDSKLNQKERASQLRQIGDRAQWEAMDPDEKMVLFHHFVSAAWLESGEIIGVDFR